MRKGGVPWGGGGGRQIGYVWLRKGGRGERQISGYVIYDRSLIGMNNFLSFGTKFKKNEKRFYENSNDVWGKWESTKDLYKLSILSKKFGRVQIFWGGKIFTFLWKKKRYFCLAPFFFFSKIWCFPPTTNMLLDVFLNFS